MPIISEIGRKHRGVRFLIAGIYVLLILGAVTMIYPFLVMVSGSTKSAVDARSLDVFPAFLYDDAVLYRKHIEGLFNESLEAMQNTYDTAVPSFELVEKPASRRPEFVKAWRGFLRETTLPGYACTCGYMAAPVSKTIPSGLREFKACVAERYGRSISAVNLELGTDFVGWNAFHVVPASYLSRVRMPQGAPFEEALRAFCSEQAWGDRYYPSPEAFYKRQFLRALYTRSIETYNAMHGTAYAGYDEIILPATVPAEGLERKDWELFVRENLNLLWIRVGQGVAPLYREFLRAKYGRIDVLNRNYGTSYRDWTEIPIIGEPPLEGLALSDWAGFISGWKDPETGRNYQAPLRNLRIVGVDFAFRDYLGAHFETVEDMNAALGTDYESFESVELPQRDAHYADFLDRRGELRWEFVTRNYKTVVDYIVFHGRGVLNTAIYCSLAVFFALLINPLAAYAMSRYRMPSTYKILLFLMLTMAFPAMVTQIPVFLMLRRLNLLNTFAALILPGLANGYSIFLLKGFFDSLPQELYECAELEGASEWTMFWQITMSLSKPILSVIALQAFTLAYSNFMYALLICQDERMWTLMVWLYQLQGRSGPAVIHASLLIAAIPTFIIFIFCQKIILRGIVVPVEK